MVGESDRKMLKAAIKRGSGEDKVRHRVVSADGVAKWKETLDELKDEVEAVLKEEKEEKAASGSSAVRNDTNGMLQMRQAEMELRKGQNMIDHEKEIYSRPARTWFQSTKDKQKAEGRTVLKKESSNSGTIHLDISKREYQSGFATEAGPPITGGVI